MSRLCTAIKGPGRQHRHQLTILKTQVKVCPACATAITRSWTLAWDLLEGLPLQAPHSPRTLQASPKSTTCKASHALHRIRC
jgi:hypothetical protein